MGPHDLPSDRRRMNNALAVRVSPVQQALPTLERPIMSAIESVKVGATPFFVFARLFTNTTLPHCEQQVLDCLKCLTNPWVSFGM